MYHLLPSIPWPLHPSTYTLTSLPELDKNIMMYFRSEK
uniref:Cell division protein FtsY homologic n=1 Tax=Rhizophora mucronata TaxID=61149 RepID=A0A2P2KFY1_RHIMU